MATPPFRIIAGPTASGKSAVAVAVAERIGAEIIGADAFQIYRGFDRLSAKPEPELLERIPHHLIGELPPSEPFHVARFRELVVERIEAVRSRGKIPLIVGGSGLYLRAVMRPLAELPPADAALRDELDREETPALLARLGRLDPGALAWIDRANRRRLIRAIEVCILTGKPFSATRTDRADDPAGPCGVVLVRDRGDLRDRIRARTERLFADGVLDEVRSGAADLGQTAAQMLGLREIEAVLRGERSETEAVEAIGVATRQYAKRQMTWFRREPDLVPFAVPIGAAPEALAAPIAKILGEMGRPVVGPLRRALALDNAKGIRSGHRSLAERDWRSRGCDSAG
jgi:tRNA dimethylallyltransferase